MEDKLSSESGRSYDLEDEHRAIRDILRRERKRRGDVVGGSSERKRRDDVVSVSSERSKVKVAVKQAKPSSSKSSVCITLFVWLFVTGFEKVATTSHWK